MHILTGGSSGSDDSEDPPTNPTPVSSATTPALKPLEELLAGSPDEEDSLGHARTLLDAQLPPNMQGDDGDEPTTAPTQRDRATPMSASPMSASSVDEDTPQTHRGPIANKVRTPSLDDLRRSRREEPTPPPGLWSRIRAWLGL